jgi:hypothetical protein
MSAVIEGTSILIADVAVAVAIVVECIRLFADDGVDAKVRIVDGGGTCGDVDGNADGFIGAAVAAVVSIIVIVVAVAALIVVMMQGWWGASDIGGNVAEVEGMP